MAATDGDADPRAGGLKTGVQLCYDKGMKSSVLPSNKSQRFLLYAADWNQYVQMRRSLDERGQHAFITFDGHRIELMSPSMEHDRAGELLGQIVRAISLATRTRFISGGSTTFKRRSLRRGLEPDRCFWTQNQAKLHGVKQIDLQIHPPPDLVIEVEISRRLLDRRAIYARLGVPEMWLYNRKGFQILLLDKSLGYQSSTRSASFPVIRFDGIEALVQSAWSVDELEWHGLVEKWVGEALGH